MKKVYVEGSDHLISKMFEEEGFEVVKSVFDAELICLEGGADVTPALYEEENTMSHCNEKKDIHSLGLLMIAECFSLPVVGICRGSQIMNVLQGGKMKQHIAGHTNTNHNLNVDGVDYLVTSTHHQESVPQSYVDKNGETVYLEKVYKADDGTVELVMYNNKQMGFQGHPEYVSKGHPCRTVFFKKLSEIL